MTGNEHRKEKRYPYQWEVAVVFEATEQQDTYHGITNDISAGGCAILTEFNVYSEHPVSVLISLPAENPTGKRKIVEARGRIVYTVLACGGVQKFRLGIEFLNFKGNGRSILTRAFAKRDITF
ncbi:MAG TPA: PilZ domain-containing protein [Rhodocyclaceae bacterium]